MENRPAPNNSDVISKMMSNDYGTDVDHLYPICKHVPHVRRSPEKLKKEKKREKNAKKQKMNFQSENGNGNGNRKSNKMFYYFLLLLVRFDSHLFLMFYVVFNFIKLKIEMIDWTNISLDAGYVGCAVCSLQWLQRLF